MRHFLEGLIKLASLAAAIVVMGMIHVALDPGPTRGMVDWTGGILAVMFLIVGIYTLLDLLDWVTE